MDEGVVKYRCDWEEADPVAAGNIADLMDWRDRLHSWGLIGVYENGIGFGNVSVRLGTSCQFVISGTQTAHLRSLGPESYCTVTEFNLEQNFLACRGPVQASSESLTHGALYLQREDVGGIIHVHNPKLWQQLLFKIPTTRKEIPYGTPRMALEMFRLFEEENLADRKILAMAGHEDGIICFGSTLDEAGKVLSAVIGQTGVLALFSKKAKKPGLLTKNLGAYVGLWQETKVMTWVPNVSQTELYRGHWVDRALDLAEWVQKF